MRRSHLALLAGMGVLVCVAAVLLVIGTSPPAVRAEAIVAAWRDGAQYGRLAIRYPLDGTLFPPEIVAPTFRWEPGEGGCDAWCVTIAFQDDAGRLSAVTDQAEWTPEASVWERMKQRSLGTTAEVVVLGVRRSAPGRIVSEGRVSIATSPDPVGAPLFYREVNLPFVDAVKDPSQIRWRFGAIGSAEPPVVLANLPVCGNCHSFSADGSLLGMDVDYANSKGSYVITQVAKDMALAPRDVITWNDYKRADGEQTFGLLSQVSPDGQVVVSTVKDKSVFVPRDGLEFSQLFFPIKGILCVYTRATGEFHALPGADDPRYVQSNPSWSPDGKHIVFARAEAYSLAHTRGKGKVLLTRAECKEFLEDGKPFLFDLYRIPYNDGKGGTAEPLAGASRNGMSNYFARYSPDGKWIVFCKAKSYMLLQPDSELYILPAAGGEARRLRCNTPRMNSWHSWSPNGRWLVFASKARSAYTQLFLTHIDERGRSSPAVVLSHLTAADRAANIPEFVNVEPTAIETIRETYLNDYSFVRAGEQFFRAGEADNAIGEYRNALELNPDSATAHRRLGFLLYNVKNEHAEGMRHYREALRVAPDDPRTHYDLGMALLHQGRFGHAAARLATALRGMPNGLDWQYDIVALRYSLGLALLHDGKLEESAAHVAAGLRLAPDNAKLHNVLAQNHAKAGRFAEAAAVAERALRLARAAGERRLALEVEKRLELYEQKVPRHR